MINNMIYVILFISVIINIVFLIKYIYLKKGLDDFIKLYMCYDEIESFMRDVIYFIIKANLVDDVNRATMNKIVENFNKISDLKKKIFD